MSGTAADPFLTSTTGLAYCVFGGFRLRRGSTWVSADEWQRPMATRLARFLLANRQRVVPEDELLEAFWRDRDPPAGRRCLAVALSLARGVLGEDRLEVAERTYRLALRPRDRVDADDFERLASSALTGLGARPRIPLLERAAALWAGEPLPEDRYADWAMHWRERLADRHRELLAALADAHAAVGDHDASLRTAQCMLETDQLDEGAHRRVMEAYATLGRRTRALEQFIRCRRALVDGAGIEPGLETVALYSRILAGRDVTRAAA
jgi:DNA-binding SARP family transcriptional activator